MSSPTPPPPGSYGPGPQPGSNQQGPYQQGPYQQGPYQQGPYQQGPYQQGPYQQGPYQQGRPDQQGRPGPGGPGPHPGPPAPGPVPPRVRTAATLVLVVAGISVVTSLATAPLIHGYLLRTLNASFSRPDLVSPPFDLGAFATAMAVFVVVATLFGAALWVWLGLKLRVGRNWARILLTIFIAMGLVSQPLSWIQAALGHSLAAPQQPAPSALLSLIALPGVAVGVVVLVLMWGRPARDWFAAEDAYRRWQPR